jgi:hypothetical protein
MTRIILIVLIIFLIKSIFITSENFRNKEIKYIFWTGGYDSTYAICNALINGQKTVQPIYITYNLDNSSINKFWVRRNRKQELGSMETIRKEIITKFPELEQNLLPNWYVTKNLPNKEFTDWFDRENLFPKKRKVHQYEHLARFAFENKINVDLGVLGIHESTKFIKFLKQNLVKKNGDLTIPFEHPLQNLSFPIFGKSKYQLLENARENNFEDILKLTWSCWFPTKEGNPCTKCPMCIERII